MRPPKEWFSRCTAGVTESGGADPKLGGPPAVCGKVWYAKSASEQSQLVREAHRKHPFEVKVGRKTTSLHTTVKAAKRAAKSVGGVARVRETKRVLYSVVDEQNRVIARTCTCQAAHRAARRGKYGSSHLRVVR
jgi:hypothetical protein